MRQAAVQPGIAAPVMTNNRTLQQYCSRTAEANTRWPEMERAPVNETETQAEEKVRRYSAIEFLIALVLLITALPLLDDLRHGLVIEAVLLTVVLFSALLVVGASRRVLAPAVLLLIPALGGKWANHFRPDLVPPEVYLTACLLFVAYISVRLLLFVLRAPKVTAEVLCAAISNYLLLGLLWMFAYLLTARFAPGAFAYTAGPIADHRMDSFNAIYFSFTTMMSSVAYGDILPVGRVARMLAFTQAITGLFYMAMMIARLVALYTSERHHGGTHDRQ